MLTRFTFRKKWSYHSTQFYITNGTELPHQSSSKKTEATPGKGYREWMQIFESFKPMEINALSMCDNELV